MDIELIPKYIINLPERTDRLRSIEHELKWMFFDDTYFLVDGIRSQPIQVGIALSHMAAIKQAKDNLSPYCIVMEDDCVFQAKEHTREYVYNALDNLPEDWDILLGGIYETKGLKKYNEYWSLTKEFCGLHFYIIKNTAYDKFLSYTGTMHIDRYLVAKLGLKAYVTNKLFATQLNGYSDNARQTVNYSDKLARFKLL